MPCKINKLIQVKVIPNSKRSLVIREDNLIKVYVKKPAVNNKANEEAIELLSEFFKIRKNQVRIIKGEKSRKKIIEILNE